MKGVTFIVIVSILANVISTESYVLNLRNPRFRRSLIHTQPSANIKGQSDGTEDTSQDPNLEPNVNEQSIDEEEPDLSLPLQIAGVTSSAFTEPRGVLKPRNYEKILEMAKKIKPNETDNEKIGSSFEMQGRGATGNLSLRWNYEMLIDIDEKFDSDRREEIQSGIWTLKETMTCFKFNINPAGQKVPRTAKDYLSIAYGGSKGCYSELGRKGGKQETVLSDSCTSLYGVTMHEILHVLGFFHEHVRPDRDKYVTINWDDPTMEDEDLRHQYLIRDNQLTFYKYDFDSIMHYRFNYVISQKAPIPDDVQVGQRDHLSEGDKVRLRKLYPCSKAPSQ